jgi:hypothetical protein
MAKFRLSTLSDTVRPNIGWHKHKNKMFNENKIFSGFMNQFSM